MSSSKTLWSIALCALLVAEPVAARFLSPDPEPADHENFNRYWYANDNPYTFVDPDGRWACEKQGANCDTFRQGMQNLETSSQNASLSTFEQAQLQNVRGFYGAEGDPRVTIRFPTLDGEGGYATDKEVGIDLAAARRSAANGQSAESNTLNALTKIIVHEGDHGARWTSGEAFKIPRLELEIMGYATQAIFQKSAGFIDPNGAPNGWTPLRGIDHSTIEGQAVLSTLIACGSVTGCDGK